MKSINRNTMRNWRKAFSILLLAVGLFACLQSFAPAKIERSKVIKKDFDAKPEVSASHQYGPLTIKKSTDGRIHLEAEMLLTGSDEASIEEVLGRFDVAVKESENELRLETDLGIEGCNTINNRMTIKYKDGHKVKGIGDMTVKMTLWVPNPGKLKLDNKYDRIELADDYNGELRVMLYSGDFVAANLGGSLDLDLKYGKAKMGNVEKAKLNIYDSKVNMGNLSQARVDSKYSEFVLGNVSGDMKLQTYDEKWQVGNVGGKLTLDDKYSEFKFEDIGEVEMSVFDADFVMENVGKMEILDTKYSKYKLENIALLKISSSFDDDFKIKAAEHAGTGDSKYSEYHIGHISKNFSIGQSFDDMVVLEEVAANFEHIGFDGKYTEMTLNIAEGGQFKFSINMKYGKANYPGGKVTVLKEIEKDGQTIIEGYVGAEPNELTVNKLSISGFDNTLNWR